MHAAALSSMEFGLCTLVLITYQPGFKKTPLDIALHLISA